MVEKIVRIGIKHPDPVVETASLSSVLPPDVYFRLNIPEEVIDDMRLNNTTTFLVMAPELVSSLATALVLERVELLRVLFMRII